MKKMAFQEKVKILSNRRMGSNYFKLTLDSAKISRAALPGQFVEVRITDGPEPLLRRPLGIHGVKNNKLELLCQIAGKGTEMLSKKMTGEYLDVIGPLGRGFNYKLQANRTRVLVAGGMGVAPLLFLAQKISRGKNIVLIGAKTKSQILCERGFRKLGFEVKISTDDGTKGFKGYASDLLKQLLPTIDYRLSIIYACGPKPMLKEVGKLSAEYDLPAQISLEEHMACGIGACLGCVVNTQDGFKRVCKDGPVFENDKIIW